MDAAPASKRAATLTTLVIGKVEMAVGLFTTSQEPGKLAEFQTAGPNGFALYYADQAAEAPLSSETPLPEIPVGRADPLADDPVPPNVQHPDAIEATALTPGEFKQTLLERESGQAVSSDEVRRGVRGEDGSFVDCTVQLARIEEETKLEQMEVVDFMDVGQVERARVEGSYYIGAGEAKAAKPLRLIYEAMRGSRRVAIVKWSSRSRQSLGVLTAHGASKTLVLLKLAWAEDWRAAPAKALSIQGVAVTEDEVAMARRLVEAMSGTASSLDGLRDDAIERREILHAEAVAGNVAPIEEPKTDADDLDLGDAFAASVEALLATPRAGKG